MKTNSLKRFLRNSVLVASVPTVSGCLCYGGGDCGKRTLVPFNGTTFDGGPLADGGRTEDGGLDSSACSDICGRYANSCSIADAGLVECTSFCVGGRAPPGLLELSTVDGSAGSWVSRMAELETAAAQVGLMDERQLKATIQRLLEHSRV